MAPCKPGANPKDILRRELRKEKKNVPTLENDVLATLVEKATSEILDEYKDRATVPEEMKGFVEERLRAKVDKALHDLAQVGKKVANQPVNSHPR